jgi:multimeric flavodoxin WrbA
MKYKVVYFSRTGTSKKVAEKIADKLSCEIIQIKDNMNWKGIFGYIKAGFYSSTDREVKIEIQGNLDAADELIVVGPIWAGGVASAVRTFLKTTLLDKVHLVATSNGSILENNSGYKSVHTLAKNMHHEDEVINDLMSTLK